MKFSDEEERIWALIRPRLAGEPYRPPRVRDIAKAMNIDEALRAPADAHGGATRRRRGDRARSFLPAIGRAEDGRDRHRCRRACADGRFTAADFRDRLDNGRKVAIQILEFFDRHGFTIRRQDLRRINPARIEFFAPKAAQTG